MTNEKMLVEKSTPVKPKFWTNGAWAEYLCPKCSMTVADWDGGKWIHNDVCESCVQVIDWSKYND